MAERMWAQVLVGPGRFERAELPWPGPTISAPAKCCPAPHQARFDPVDRSSTVGRISVDEFTWSSSEAWSADPPAPRTTRST